MRDTPFITQPLSVALDLVRALAALAVLIGHAVQLGHYDGYYPFSTQFQHNAVIVFFVLSGLVITASVDRAQSASRPQTLASYAVARAARILPVALPALAISLAVMLLDALILPTAIFGEDAVGVPASEWLFALLFLSESYQTAFAPNPPYWSLCYEVWFYALFAVATFLGGWQRLFWLAVLGALAGPNVLLLFPVWLVGVGLARLPIARRVPVWLGAAFVMLAVVALFAMPMISRPIYGAIESTVPWRMGFSILAITDLLLGLALALGFAGLRGLTLNHGAWFTRIAPPVRYAANMSFSLYLLHWPLLKLLRVLREPENGPLGFALVLAVILVASAVFATLTEHHTPRFKALLERIVRPRQEAPAAA
ncbi:acyltransferase family protein [Novosphingobium sp. JCM 18896]|uniref:acyltransferase family protein n=1 Tax=Novosphingobium sp. JCM 18896 TaxID=2989731 RepID=UPI002223D662|nr:acyltransferase [Novosphingobium sp. JCM 18896]MCW1428605.1 acyltransferase [Novosphingobium sp. JCM 18896]